MSQPTSRPRRTAAAGTIAVGMAVAFFSFGIVRAAHVRRANSVTYNCSSGTACVEGNASGSATDGIYGSSSGNGTHGVYGTGNNAGVTGYTSSTTGGSGVSGVSTSGSGSGNGVYGRSSSGQGVYGTSSVSHGVKGVTTVGFGGAHGSATGNGTGIFAESNATSSQYAALYAQGDSANTELLVFENEAASPSGLCEVGGDAELYCSGGISSSAVLAQHRSSSGRRVAAYVSESATATIEDFGTARITDGVASVQIDPAFASVMERGWYYVFLTPLGDTRGLYVSLQTPSSFEVRESAHGRDSLAFDYRIAAHPRDAENDRLPPAPSR